MDLLQLPVFDGSIHSDGSLDETDEHLTDVDLEEGLLERNTVESDTKCAINEQKSLEDVGISFEKSVFKESVQLRDAEIQTDFHEIPGASELSQQQKCLDLEIEECTKFDAGVQTDFHESPGLKSHASEPDNDLSIKNIETAVQGRAYSPVTETSSQCNILQIEGFNGGMTVKFGDHSSDICKFKKVMESKDIGIQLLPDEFGKKPLPKDETLLDNEKHSYNDTGVDSAVQCNIIEILTHEEEILEIFNDFQSLRFKKIPITNDGAVQTDIQEYGIINNDEVVSDVMGDDVVVNDVLIDDVMKDDDVVNDVIGDDVMCNKAIGIVPEVEEDGVREKHDGEPSEKTLMALGWKDFVDSSDLGVDAKFVDCIVYEKEDVFIVICESYRKYCKEISSNDYTFDSDDDITSEPLETRLEDETKHSSNDIICDNTVLDKLDFKIVGENDYSEGAGTNFETLNLDCNKNVPKAIEQAAVSSKTVVERSIEKCEIGIQCDSQEDEYVTNVGGRCPHCMKPITNNASENRSFSGDIDGSMLYSEFNEGEDVTGRDGDNEVDLIEGFRPVGVDFAFREMCDFGVQCGQHDVINHASKNVPCLYCGHSKSSCSDIAIQCESTDILSSDVHNGLSPSLNDISCLFCGQFKTLCSDASIQCEFSDLLSSSNGMLGEISEIPVVLQEDEGESLIKEVMALAKECSKNDALIDQHLNEVVRGQGLFNQIQDGEIDDEDVDQGEIALSNKNSLDLYSEIPENEQFILRDFGRNSEKYTDDDVISEKEEEEEEGMPNFPWKEVRDVETQCCENELLEKEEKAVQCTLLGDGQQFDIETIRAGEDLAGQDFAGDEVSVTSLFTIRLLFPQ